MCVSTCCSLLTCGLGLRLFFAKAKQVLRFVPEGAPRQARDLTINCKVQCARSWVPSYVKCGSSFPGGSKWSAIMSKSCIWTVKRLPRFVVPLPASSCLLTAGRHPDQDGGCVTPLCQIFQPLPLLLVKGRGVIYKTTSCMKKPRRPFLRFPVKDCPMSIRQQLPAKAEPALMGNAIWIDNWDVQGLADGPRQTRLARKGYAGQNEHRRPVRHMCYHNSPSMRAYLPWTGPRCRSQ